MQYVYLVQSGDDYFKIGIANDPKSRLAQLQTGNPIKLQLVSCYAFEDATPVEKALHQKYSEFRVNGEWFTFDYNPRSDFSLVCDLLGGKPLDIPQAQQEAEPEEVELAEESQEVSEIDKFDYAQMFADGWRMADQDNRGLYWNWRRGNDNREVIYGGAIKKLPYSIENMRRVYRDGLEPVSDL